MNSRNLSEKAFDTEIKGRLENSGVPFDPESWEKMSQKLDHVFPNNNSSDRGLFGLLVVAFLLSAWFFWNVGTFSQTKSSLLGTDNITVGQTTDNLNVGQTTDNITTGQTTDNITAGQIADNTTVGRTANKSPERSEIFPVSESEDVTNSVKSKHKGLLETDATNLKENDAAVMVSYIAPITPDVESLDQQSLPDEIRGINLNIEDLPVIPEYSSPWLIGFGYAPDFSLVGSSEVSKPGTSLSILLEFQLNRRWSINSGITYSMKNYTAKAEDYHPPKGFWDYGVVPDMTEGYCDVIDIPLNIRYYFKPEKINRLFASTGLSTYLMLTEDYYYHYQQNDPYLVQSWSGTNENQHYFAIYNLSVGYQRSMGKQWFLEIEPFVKLPLTGVGFGEVDLWSTGASFSLKYNF
jgi:hypothetical protein